MKKVTMTLALIGALTMGLAEDSIDAQIEAIQEAPAQERVRLMNEFKQQLAAMNSEDRSEAIEKLQTRTQTKTQARTRAQEMQTQNSEEMTRTQNMNQNQTANQYMQSNSQGSSASQNMMGQ